MGEELLLAQSLERRKSGRVRSQPEGFGQISSVPWPMLCQPAS